MILRHALGSIHLLLAELHIGYHFKPSIIGETELELMYLILVYFSHSTKSLTKKKQSTTHSVSLLRRAELVKKYRENSETKRFRNVPPQSVLVQHHVNDGYQGKNHGKLP